jgi:hypothetical protein
MTLFILDFFTIIMLIHVRFIVRTLGFMRELFDVKYFRFYARDH